MYICNYVIIIIINIDILLPFVKSLPERPPPPPRGARSPRRGSGPEGNIYIYIYIYIHTYIYLSLSLYIYIYIYIIGPETMNYQFDDNSIYQNEMN